MKRVFNKETLRYEWISTNWFDKIIVISGYILGICFAYGFIQGLLGLE